MKFQKLLVIVVSVCLMAFFNVSSFAKTYKAKKPRNVDIDAIADALEDAGLEGVDTEKNSLEFIAPNGEAVKIEFKDRKKKATFTVDGNNANGLDANNLTAIQQQADDLNFVECINVATEILGLKLELCEFDTGGTDLLCIPEASFDFALNVLRCVQYIGEDPEG